METCPFNDPDFTLSRETPCPVCGVKSWPYATMEEVDDKCVEGLLGGKTNETQSPSSAPSTR